LHFTPSSHTLWRENQISILKNENKAINIINNTCYCFFFIGCKPSHITLISSSEDMKDAVIRNSILDFSNSCKLYKKNSIFSVSFVDSVYSLAFDSEAFRWYKDKYYDDLVCVRIIAHRIDTVCEGCCNKFLYTAQTTIGSKGKLPSHYIEKDGKLFFWPDDYFPLSEKMIAILWKYNLLCDDTAGLIGIPEFTIDDKQKGADYYYSKYNLSKYKRVVTNIGYGYYKPPKLN
jgi:hypothetical protein